jgi:hypothetical protein
LRRLLLELLGKVVSNDDPIRDLITLRVSVRGLRWIISAIRPLSLLLDYGERVKIIMTGCVERKSAMIGGFCKKRNAWRGREGGRMLIRVR